MGVYVNEKLRREFERYRNRSFVKAVLAVCALTACADPTTSNATRHRVESIVDRLDRLGCIDRRQADLTLKAFARAIERDMDQTSQTLHAKIRYFAGDHKRMRTLLRIAYMIIVADDVITPAEQAEFHRLCLLLSVEPGAIIGGLQAGPA